VGINYAPLVKKVFGWQIAGLMREYDFIVTGLSGEVFSGAFPGTTIDKIRHFVDSPKAPCPSYKGFRGIRHGKLSTK
jgi:hypothetical protein